MQEPTSTQGVPEHPCAQIEPFWPYSERMAERLGIEAEFAAELLAGFVERLRREVHE